MHTFFLLSLGTVACTIPSQTSSTTLRTQLMTLATVTQAVMGTIFTFTTSYMINLDETHLNGKVGFGFGGLGLLASIGSHLLVPELKNRSYFTRLLPF
ncbi:hypothetical protein MY10362_000355 [Beauveria mimosiformis]